MSKCGRCEKVEEEDLPSGWRLISCDIRGAIEIKLCPDCYEEWQMIVDEIQPFNYKILKRGGES